MNKYFSMAVTAGLLAQGMLWSGSVSAQVADLNEIGTDPHRAVIVDVMILANGTAEFIEAYVTDVPPGTSIGDPQQIMLESLDATDIIIGTEYSWDPRWVFIDSAMPDIDGVFGEELEVLAEAKGSFAVLFDKDLDSVRITDVETTFELITVDVRGVVEEYCYQDVLGSFGDVSLINPECITMTFSDDDLDGIFDVQDNCPGIPNTGQEDVLNRGIGDACARPGDLDGDGDVDWRDTSLFWSGIIPHLVPGSLSIPAFEAGGYDLRPMDINGDGTINVLDARKVVLLCDELYCGWSF